MPSKIALIGNAKSHLAQRLKEEALKNKIDFTVFSLNKIRFCVNENKVKALGPDNEDLTNYATVYFYGMGNKLLVAQELARFLAQNKVRVLDPAIALGGLPHDKLYALGQHILPAPDFTFYFNITEKQTELMHYPIIAKTPNQRMARGVSLINSQQELKNFIKEFGKQVIIQKFLPVKGDYRVLVVGIKVAGVVQRSKKNLNLLGLPKDQEIELPLLPQEILDKAVIAVKNKNLAIAGVDIAHYNGKFYCFEINCAPRIKKLEKKTGENIAKKILSFLANTQN